MSESVLVEQNPLMHQKALPKNILFLNLEHSCAQKALFQGLEELHLNHGLIITYDHEGEIVEEHESITILPAYTFFCLSVDKKMELLHLK